MFLAECGEDEVGMRDGQKVTLSLRTLFRALAPDSARPRPQLAIANLVSRALWIVVGVDKARQPRLLVWLQNLAAVPGACNQHQARSDQDQCLSKLIPPKNSPTIRIGV